MAQDHGTETAPTFKPYVAPDALVPEFTVRAVVLGMLFGIIFGAVTVYVGLRAGLTVSASIPIAVLSISLLRALGKASILENNIVQTTGSAGESVAAGVIFTLPALIFLGFPLEYSRIFLLALFGGWLGVLFMIPLRRQLIVKEHGNLTYPEGTACADVLIAGEKGGSFASRVFWGLGLGGVYTALQNSAALRVIREEPTYDPSWLPGSSLRATITSEYLGVGYIIGPKVAGTIFAGGVFSWFVMMPAIKFFGGLVPTPIYPGTIPIADMGPSDLWRTYVRPIGAGAVAAAGLITLLKTLPTIVAALKAGFKKKSAADAAAGDGGPHRPRPPEHAGAGRLRRDRAAALVAADLQARARRAHERLPQPRGLPAGGGLRLPVRDRLLAHLRPDRHLGQPGLRHDDRDPDGDLRPVPGRRLDQPGLRGAGADHRRRGLHRGRQRRRHLPGPEDRLPGGRHAVLPAARPVRRGDRLGGGHRPDPDHDEQGPRGVPAETSASR